VLTAWAIVAFLNTLTGSYRGQVLRPTTVTPRNGGTLR
jgi:cytochrome c peroxidase